jgi:hypothetical protein
MDETATDGLSLLHCTFFGCGAVGGYLLFWLEMTPSALSRQLARLRSIGLIKKVAKTYRYYLTRLGRCAIAAACSITRFSIIPAMAQTA